MGRINVLPFAVANLIAAGEVVDRPASVIKELLENAIDSGADRITVEIQNGGVTFMRVTDNGCGMEPDDLPVAIRRHATSKIREAADLDGILTLGFRGEALAAIASVSNMRILSKTADAPFGAMLEARGGEIVSLSEQGCSTGTSVIVEDLFANVPARRKFLKKDVTESMAVTANVEKIALSHPGIALRLIVDGNVKLETAGDGNLQNTIYAVFGKDFATRLIEVNSESDGIGIRGFIGRSDNFKANRNYQNFFINGRFVKSRTAMAALEQAYTSYMPPEKFPCCVLYIDIHPARVDVNVHPAKLEVKFSNEKPVFEAIYYTVRTALENNATRPSMNLELGTRGKNRGFAGRVSEARLPVQEGKRESLKSAQLSYDLEGKTQPQPQIRMTAEEFRSAYGEKEKKSSPYYQSAANHALPTKGNLPTVTEETVKTSPPKAEPPAPKKTAETPAAPSVPPVAPAPKTEASLPPASKMTEAEPAPQPVASEPPVAEPIPTPAPESPAVAPLRSYRILGEAFRCYVLVEIEEKLLVIDKHAAHERILFEQLKAGMQAKTPVSQLLMIPIDVMMTSAEVEALKEYGEELEKIGFSLRYARNTVSADAIPEGVDVSAVPDMLGTMAGRILSSTGSVKLTRDILFEKALYQAACKAAIKGGRAYAEEHIEWLVKKLMEIPDITFCPHGRPVALELSHHTLDKQFDRTGF
ncbi:MAG: DNA mismatch repair endonuclease MutL [Clostridia bacterium]|nr:DNA mismatch repair endonuclease MutL [Clostridia bacterium]